MRERGTTLTPLAAVTAAGGVLGVCCGLPVLFSLGVAGAVTGLSVSSWAVLGVGLVLAALGGGPVGAGHPTHHPGGVLTTRRTPWNTGADTRRNHGNHVHHGRHDGRPPVSESYDLMVIGAGMAGVAAATKCATAGWRVAIVDALPFAVPAPCGGATRRRSCGAARRSSTVPA